MWILTLLLSRGLHRLMQDSWAKSRKDPQNWKQFDVQTQPWSWKSVCSLCHHRALMGSKSYRQVERSIRVHKISWCILPLRCTLPLLCILQLLSWSVHREKCPNSSTIHWFHSACTSSRCSRSTLTTVCFCARRRRTFNIYFHWNSQSLVHRSQG